MAEAMSVIMGIAYQQASLSRRYKKQKVSITRHLLASWPCGERGSRTYEIIENHKISIRCKLRVYKIVKFIETHRMHFDI